MYKPRRLKEISPRIKLVPHRPTALGYDIDAIPKNVYGRLRSRLSWWERHTLDPTVISWIRNGYPLPLADPSTPPHPRAMLNYSSALSRPQITQAAVDDLLDTGAAIPWSLLPPSITLSRPRPTVLSPLSLVAQGEKFRLVIDLSFVNSFLSPPHFKYESLANLADMTRPDLVMFKLDLKAGFHHLDITPEHQQFLGFTWKNTDYVFRSLPFGLSSAPHAFTMLTRALATRWRSLGISNLSYVDDLLFLDLLNHIYQSRHIILTDLSNAALLLKEVRLRPPAPAPFPRPRRRYDLPVPSLPPGESHPT